MESSITVELARYVKPALAIITGLLGWLVKDYFFGVVSRRREVVRAEWKVRLTEVWGPLYYWSGVIRMRDEKKGWDRHGVKELENLVKENVHLIPQKHFYSLVRLIECATGQNTSPIDEPAYARTRRFIYERILILNHLLYRQTREYDPDAYTDPLAGPRTLLRAITLVFVHGVVWALILGVPAVGYLAWIHNWRWVLWLMALPVLFVALGAAVEYRRRIAVHRAVVKLLYPTESWTWKALLGRLALSFRSAWQGNSVSTLSEASARTSGASVGRRTVASERPGSSKSTMTSQHRVPKASDRKGTGPGRTNPGATPSA